MARILSFWLLGAAHAAVRDPDGKYVDEIKPYEPQVTLIESEVDEVTLTVTQIHNTELPVGNNPDLCTWPAADGILFKTPRKAPVVDLSDNEVAKQIGITHITSTWMGCGHEPEEKWGYSHYDFNVWTVPRVDREAMTDKTKFTGDLTDAGSAYFPRFFTRGNEDGSYWQHGNEYPGVSYDDKISESANPINPIFHSYNGEYIGFESSPFFRWFGKAGALQHQWSAEYDQPLVTTYGYRVKDMMLKKQDAFEGLAIQWIVKLQLIDFKTPVVPHAPIVTFDYMPITSDAAESGDSPRDIVMTWTQLHQPSLPVPEEKSGVCEAVGGVDIDISSDALAHLSSDGFVYYATRKRRLMIDDPLAKKIGVILVDAEWNACGADTNASHYSLDIWMQNLNWPVSNLEDYRKIMRNDAMIPHLDIGPVNPLWTLADSFAARPKHKWFSTGLDQEEGKLLQYFDGPTGWAPRTVSISTKNKNGGVSLEYEIVWRDHSAVTLPWFTAPTDLAAGAREYGFLMLAIAIFTSLIL